MAPSSMLLPYKVEAAAGLAKLNSHILSSRHLSSASSALLRRRHIVPSSPATPSLLSDSKSTALQQRYSSTASSPPQRHLGSPRTRLRRPQLHSVAVSPQAIFASSFHRTSAIRQASEISSSASLERRHLESTGTDCQSRASRRQPLHTHLDGPEHSKAAAMAPIALSTLHSKYAPPRPHNTDTSPLHHSFSSLPYTCIVCLQHPPCSLPTTPTLPTADTLHTARTLRKITT